MVQKVMIPLAVGLWIAMSAYAVVARPYERTEDVLLIMIGAAVIAYLIYHVVMVATDH